jgi:hypothetical protein
VLQSWLIGSVLRCCADSSDVLAAPGGAVNRGLAGSEVADFGGWGKGGRQSGRGEPFTHRMALGCCTLSY